MREVLVSQACLSYSEFKKVDKLGPCYEIRESKKSHPESPMRTTLTEDRLGLTTSGCCIVECIHSVLDGLDDCTPLSASVGYRSLSVASPTSISTDLLTTTTMSFKQQDHKLLVIPGPIEVSDDVLLANAHPRLVLSLIGCIETWAFTELLLQQYEPRFPCFRSRLWRMYPNDPRGLVHQGCAALPRCW